MKYLFLLTLSLFSIASFNPHKAIASSSVTGMDSSFTVPTCSAGDTTVTIFRGNVNIMRHFLKDKNDIEGFEFASPSDLKKTVRAKDHFVKYGIIGLSKTPRYRANQRSVKIFISNVPRCLGIKNIPVYINGKKMSAKRNLRNLYQVSIKVPIGKAVKVKVGNTNLRLNKLGSVKRKKFKTKEFIAIKKVSTDRLNK